MGVPLPKVWETFLPHYSRMEREETDTYFLERLTENINSGNGKLYPNVKEVFRYLKENDCNIYIASNGLINYLDAIVNYFDLNHWITETFSIEQIDSLNKSNLVRYIVKKI